MFCERGFCERGSSGGTFVAATAAAGTRADHLLRSRYRATIYLMRPHRATVACIEQKPKQKSMNRPDPDELLDKLQRDEEKRQRGKLKVFFGASAGVGKTYAMLQAARRRQTDGVDVLVGIAETHGRSETAALLEGLEVLPLAHIEYRGRKLGEFDLDAALARKPQLILVDELAHSNVQGARHLKRWQDVYELLDAGIDVYTTVNVQHLESLNDVVGQITGIRVWETVPDRVFDRADEVTLVDLPAEELLDRMRDGKVYMAQQAERAVRNFFRKGNLIALRELALRRTADRVDAQMREYRADRSIQRIWQARERLLVCVGPGPEAPILVRAAARLASALKADWLAVYVETPKLQRLPDWLCAGSQRFQAGGGRFAARRLLALAAPPAGRPHCGARGRPRPHLDPRVFGTRRHRAAHGRRRRRERLA
jgi:K+-sensing histidine kinase KdpD